MRSEMAHFFGGDQHVVVDTRGEDHCFISCNEEWGGAGRGGAESKDRIEGESDMTLS